MMILISNNVKIQKIRPEALFGQEGLNIGI